MSVNAQLAVPPLLGELSVGANGHVVSKKSELMLNALVSTPVLQAK
ncbi:MAG: hypothetical protein WCJ39_00225 [bacterium]